MKRYKAEISEDIQSPLIVLKEKFLTPSKCSGKALALMTGIKVSSLKGMWSHSVIHRISSFTNTSPRYWYYQQLNWRFHNYIIKRKSSEFTKEVPLKFHIHNEIICPGRILESRYIRPLGYNLNFLEKNMCLPTNTLQNIIHEKLAITQLTAYRLSKSLRTSIRYWLDLQSAYEVNLLIKSNLIRNPYVRESLISYKNKIYSNIQDDSTKDFVASSPGKLLLKKYIEPSNISKLDWQHLFCLSPNTFNRITSGKSEMNLFLILKLCRIFKTDVEYWIHAQNAYRAWTALINYRRLKSQPKVLSNQIITSGRHPFQILVNGFLKPMGLTANSFLTHLNLNAKAYKHLEKGRKKIDFELAIRFGQALNMNPNYWLYLQLEHDIQEFEQGRYRSHLH